jgi:putative MATE family efflux protein
VPPAEIDRRLIVNGRSLIRRRMKSLRRFELWQALKEAVRGSEQDFTKGPIGRAVLLLAVPMVLEMSMESLFMIVDIFWVSKLGSGAVATVGLTESMLALIYSVAIGLSAGATAIVARRTGEKDPDGAAKTAVQVIAVAFGVSAAIGVVGVWLAPHLLAAMGGSAEVVAVGSGYTTVMLGGCATIVLLFVVNAIFRGTGDAVSAMHSLWLANILNIILGPCFIYGLGPFPEMGVTGAAVATTIGRGTGVVYQLILLARGKGRLKISRRHLRFDVAAMKALLRISSVGMLQTLVETASWLGLVRILATFGDAALAGYTIAMRVAVFALLPPFGIANAAASLVGQNLGAGQPERAERSVWIAAFYNFAFLGLVGVAFAIAPAPIVSLFDKDPAVVAVGVDCLRIVALGFFFYAYGMVMPQAFNGAGDTLTPTILNVCCFWLFKIPLAYFLAVSVGIGPRGVFMAITAAYSAVAVAGVILFRRGRWKTKKV